MVCLLGGLYLLEGKGRDKQVLGSVAEAVGTSCLHIPVGLHSDCWLLQLPSALSSC
ncbi:hypothetical protein Bca4012_071797 [Brassica carinata]|nr:unnamed protein product [Brassica oleracea]